MHHRFDWNNPYPTIRVPVFARNVVATSHPLAAQAGLRMIAAGGSAVQVPSNMVYKLRMDLASKGLPGGEGVGFEIFDKGQFGLSDFVQRTNYLRAVQGELARTITQLQGVRSARLTEPVVGVGGLLGRDQGGERDGGRDEREPGADRPPGVGGAPACGAKGQPGQQARAVQLWRHGGLLGSDFSGPLQRRHGEAPGQEREYPSAGWC